MTLRCYFTARMQEGCWFFVRCNSILNILIAEAETMCYFSFRLTKY